MKTFLKVGLALAWVGCAGAGSNAAREKGAGVKEASEVKVPPTARENIVETLHGVKVADPYRWLENEKDPRVQAWMKAQDAVTREYLHGLAARPALLERLKALAYVESSSVPVQRGKRLFYLRTHTDKEKAVLYWRAGEKGAEKVLLDPNTWSTDGTLSLGVWVPSWDGKKLVFAQKPNAADEAILHVMDVDSGEWSKVDVIPGGKYADPDWTPDNKAFVYEWLPSDPSIPVADRPGYTELRLHRLGTGPEQDAMLHPKLGDPKTFLNGQLSPDGKYLFAIHQRGWAETDVYFQRFGKDTTFALLAKGQNARHEILAWKDVFYLVTDEGAPRRRIFKVTPDKPDRAHWKELVPEDPEAVRQDAAVVGGHLALNYLRNAVSELRVATLEGKVARKIALPGLGTTSNLVGPEDSDTAYFQFSSFTVPKQVYRASVRSGATQLFSKVNLPIQPERFTVEQVWFTSKDQQRVPMFLIHAKDLVKDGNRPVLLYGYGGFDISLTPEFRGSIYPWLEAGGVYAVANLRGGGEFGAQWHEAGWRDKKQNVFDDFIAAAEFLIAQRYTRPERLAISGRSNGGLLVGAAMTQRPDLFAAVLCGVPLLDMVRYHRFGSGMTWISEYGSADDLEGFRTLHAYSPYHRVKEAAYPALLMLATDHDDRVDPMHARKFVAAVQHATTSPRPVLLRVEANAGHAGGDQVKKAVDQLADEYAFLMRMLGLDPKAAVAPPPSAQR